MEHKSELTTIAKLNLRSRGFDIEVIVLDVGKIICLKDNKIYPFVVADKTGSILMNLWDKPGDEINSGDILRITSGEAKLFKGFLQLAISRFGRVNKIGEHTFVYSEKPNFSEFVWNEQEALQRGPKKNYQQPNKNRNI